MNGDYYYQQGRYEDAIESYLLALKENDKDITVYNRLGLSFHAINDFVGAVYALEKAIELDSSYVEAYHNLALVYLDLEKPDSAISLCEKALEIDSLTLENYSTLGYTYIEGKRYSSAHDVLKKGIVLGLYQSKESILNGNFNLRKIIAGDLAELYHYLGIVYSSSERSKEAIAAFESASSYDLYWSTPLIYKGLEYEKLNKYDLAVESYLEALDIFPKDPIALNNLGHAYEMNGEYQNAINAYKRSIAADDNFALPLRNLGQLYFERGNRNEALKYYRRAAELGDDYAKDFLQKLGER